MQVPKPAQVINRGDGGVVHLRSAFGDVFDIEVNEKVSLLQIRHELAALLPHVGPIYFHQDDQFLTDESHIDPERAVDFTYPLSGGGTTLEVVKTIPEMLRLHILCWKAGCQQVGNFQDSVWCENTFCCLFHRCGTQNILKEQQLACVKVSLTPPGCGCDTTMPACLQAKCLCWNCGLKSMPDLQKDDWVTDSVLCVYSNCGPKDCASPQILCFKCNC